jgi:hypothetical protein
MLVLDNETTVKVYREAVRIGGALLTKLPAARGCTLDVFGYECLVKRATDVDGMPQSTTGFAVQIIRETPTEEVGA